MKNIINEDKKVLWIAHRHELLNQALASIVSNSYSDVLTKKKQFKYRVISGVHDRPVNIEPEDDFIIASKDSINYGMNHLLRNWVNKNKNDIVLVIDEAHHAVAKSYVNIIENLEENNKNYFKLIGLTATPFRTSESEKGALKRIFKNDIIYSIDLKTLINRGILSDPIFIEEKTRIDMTNDLTDNDIKKIQRSSNLPEDIATTIAKNKVRNNLIVNHYVANRQKYGQTLVFALNIQHAIELKGVFEKHGITSDFIVSDIRDVFTNVTISKEENMEKVRRFRNGEIEVLINVNILTEGVDLPNVQTVFLTRPTISTILMTQMIGRALRGEKSGGTKEAYIVSFVDDWKDKIAWVNPESLHEGEGIITDGPYNNEYMARLISISKIEEFARMMDETVNTDELKNLSFIERIPVGIYSFKILLQSDDEPIEKNSDIMVYDAYKQAYEDFINDLDIIFEEKGLEDKEFLEDYELDYIFEEVKREYFEGYDTTIGYRDEDIKDILIYFAQTSFKPVFLPFEDREKYDVSKIAHYIYEKDMRRREEDQYLDELWDDEKSFLKIFFGGNKRYFIDQINNELFKIREGIPTEPKPKPTVIEEKIDMKKLTLGEISKIDIKYWRELTNSVYNDYRDEEGYYFSAQSGWRSKRKRDFHIDHIKPMACGGLTELSNLQLLTRGENWKKGAKCEECEGRHKCTIKETADKKKTIKKKNDVSTELKAIYKKINNLMESDKITEAIDYINDEIKENNVPELYNELGNIYFKSGDYDKAIEEYENALEIDESHIKSLYNRANLYNIYSDFDNAINLLNKVLEIDKNDYRALTLLGEIYFKRENFDEALNYYAKSNSVNKENYFGYLGMGDVYFSRGHYEDALPYYDRAIEIDNRIAVAYNMRGLCYQKLKMYDRVLDDYYKAIELDPRYADAYFNLAFELDRKRRYKEAIENYEVYIKLEPLDDLAYNNIGYTYFKMKKYKKALKYYDKAIEINPNNKNAISNRKQVEKYFKKQ